MRKVAKEDAESIYSYMKEGETYNNYEIESAMTISGRYEGLYAWIAANYQYKSLGFNTSTTEKPLTYTGQPYGIIEIGGASMQIAYPASSDLKDGNLISRKGFSNIYCKSYLGGGAKAIFKNPKNIYQIKKDFPKIESIKVRFLGLVFRIGQTYRHRIERCRFSRYFRQLYRKYHSC